MNEQKNLKISAEVHALLRARAEKLGMKINRLADAVLRKGMTWSDAILVAALYDEANGDSADAPPPTLTPPEASTTPAKRVRKR